MTWLQNYLNKRLQDPEFRKVWQREQTKSYCISCGTAEPKSKLLPFYDEETNSYYCGCDALIREVE